MNAHIKEVQHTIRASGVPGTALSRFGADGVWGAEGRTALGVLVEAARKCVVTAPPLQIGLSLADFENAARMLDPVSPLAVTVARIRAVDEVESGGGWFKDVRADILDRDGPGGFLDGPHLPKILFEAHIFDRETGGRFRSSHPNLSSARWNRALYVGGQAEYIRLDQAMALDRPPALKACSWGRYQIMGFNHAKAGFSTVEAFVDAMKESEAKHLAAFVSFIKSAGLTDAFRRIDGNPKNCQPFAAGYNGSGYAANNYDGKIAASFVKWSR